MTEGTKTDRKTIFSEIKRKSGKRYDFKEYISIPSAALSSARARLYSPTAK